MNYIDQNIALKSIDASLLNTRDLIDGRNEIDRLNFLANFASLINFYDSSNTISGNWQPFLLKDPVFLLATISKTRNTQLYNQFLRTINNIEVMIEDRLTWKYFVEPINQVFYQLTGLFQMFESWTSGMMDSSNEYNLKTYFIKEIRFVYGQYFWAILALQEEMFRTKSLKNIRPVRYYQFEKYDEKIWQQSKNKGPYWEVLGLNAIPPLKKADIPDIISSLKLTGIKVFDFLDVIVNAAGKEFEDIKVLRSNFPDTILLRAFSRLMDIYKVEINQISKKHLKFYYQDILKQRKAIATPDAVYVSAILASEDEIFLLKKDTLFQAGEDKSENPILFKTKMDTSLNPGSITNAYTLIKKENKEKVTQIFKQTIEDPGTVRKDEEGRILSWPTFGSPITKSIKPSSMGFAFGSPLLLLKEGIRTVFINFVFKNPIDPKLFAEAEYFFSTEEIWLSKCNLTDLGEEPIKEIDLNFEILITDPAIVPFLESSDDVESLWPMFKVVFTNFPCADTDLLSNPPVIDQIQLSVEVKEFSDFQLYNDDGTIQTTAPFQILGSTPMPGSSFVLGSAEMFSKPLNEFDMTFTWDNLPAKSSECPAEDAFENYYKQYNDFLKGEYKKLPEDFLKKKSSILENILSPFVNLIQLLTGKSDKKQLKEAGTDDPVIVATESGSNVENTFTNSAFKVNFEVLQDKSWSEVNMQIGLDCPEIIVLDSDDVKLQNLYCTIDDILEQTKTFLYSNDSNSEIKAFPALQLSELEYTDESSDGFLKMKLTKPKEGFGSELYGQVVSAVALRNAEIIAILVNCPDADLPMVNTPNTPYIPMASLFTINYSASNIYDFVNPENNSIKDYPIDCFYFTPFSNYRVVNFINGIDTTLFKGLNNLGSRSITSTELLLYPSFDYAGCLFIEMQNLLYPNEISPYFQLSDKGVIQKKRPEENNAIHYNYLSDAGWKEVSVLSDGCNNFSCSGIIKLNIPSSISFDYPAMPEENYWLSIGVIDKCDTNNPDSFPQTAFLMNNGFELERTGKSYITSVEDPVIESDSIESPVESIPDISSIVQAFPSFGGRSAESEKMMNRRVATRLKSKDRLVSTTDYYRVIKEAFRDVYYSKTEYHKYDKATNVYVVEKVDNYQNSNAFQPLFSSCELDSIQAYLIPRSSPFAGINVNNFSLELVSVSADIKVSPGYKFEGVKADLSLALDIFLSPWINSPSPQIIIDKGISFAEVSGFILNFPGVEAVANVNVGFDIKPDEPFDIIKVDSVQILYPRSPSGLLVTSTIHSINPIKTNE